jgi:hypothetical protein
MERLLARPTIRARFPLRNPMAVPFCAVYEKIVVATTTAQSGCR